MNQRFISIAEAGLKIQNPFSEAKMQALGEICQRLGYLQPRRRLLDLGCGQGELVCRWAQQFGVKATGVDPNAEFIEVARRRAIELAVTLQVEFIQVDAVQFPLSHPYYDMVCCLGAAEITGSITYAIHLMRKALKDEKQGLLLVGMPFWVREPNQTAADAMGITMGTFQTLPVIYDLFERSGVDLVNMVFADDEGWDRYQTHHWMQVRSWLRNNPDDPDIENFRKMIEDWKRSYLVYRGNFGWGVFLLETR
ncbi:MAG TPA: class I SAM-dependent methyltransferase [Anaerolineaceae bacterium]